MNILKYHMKRKNLNAIQLSNATGIEYNKLCRLLRQDQNHLESQFIESVKLLALLDTLDLQELKHSIKKECNAG